jgi:creatinine amidohydrolase
MMQKFLSLLFFVCFVLSLSAQEKEVRIQMLRPDQIKTLREACPIAYIPIGLLEWHGVHNAIGTDGLQAEGIAIECARRGGGVVFPTLYYGENRAAMVDTESKIAKGYGLPEDAFEADQLPLSTEQMIRNYHNLLLQILAQAQVMGYKVGVIVVGHFPLLDNALGAITHFCQYYSRINPQEMMIPWCFTNFQVMKEYKGDHGGGFETSQMIYFHPQTVDLSLLPPRGEEVLGTNMPYYDPRDANRDLGKSGVDETVEAAIREARHRLLYPALYRNNGRYIQMGLWREEFGNKPITEWSK